MIVATGSLLEVPVPNGLTTVVNEATGFVVTEQIGSCEVTLAASTIERLFLVGVQSQFYGIWINVHLIFRHRLNDDLHVGLAVCAE